MRGFPKDHLKKEVRIRPRDEYPFSILSTSARDGRNIKYQIEEKEVGSATEYLLTIENLKKDGGKYRDIIMLEIDSDIKPVIRIGVYGTIYTKGSEKKN